VATEEKAIKRLETEVPDRSKPIYKSYDARLAYFRKAAADKAARP
jgi:hypothetical protein